MQSLPKPIFDAVNLFTSCVKSYRDDTYRLRLIAASPAIGQATSQYETLATSAQLHIMPKSNGVAGVVSAQEMKDLYAEKVAAKKAPQRRVYDQLMSAAYQKLCPVCMQRAVTNLDHYLPQAEYSCLTVAPCNLIPMCFECNKRKHDFSPDSDVAQIFHPYFDNWNSGTWLYASVAPGPVLTFSAVPQVGLSPLQAARLTANFNLFQLNDLYSLHAGIELCLIKDRLVRLHSAGGAQHVHSHLKEEAASRRVARANSWQCAMYTALENSFWFCDEGFKTIDA
jgi:hypothetical protein